MLPCNVMFRVRSGRSFGSWSGSIDATVESAALENNSRNQRQAAK
jgi:hypothetical protein